MRINPVNLRERLYFLKLARAAATGRVRGRAAHRRRDQRAGRPVRGRGRPDPERGAPGAARADAGAGRAAAAVKARRHKNSLFGHRSPQVPHAHPPDQREFFEVFNFWRTYLFSSLLSRRGGSRLSSPNPRRGGDDSPSTGPLARTRAGFDENPRPVLACLAACKTLAACPARRGAAAH